MSAAGRLTAAALIEQACEWAGRDDFGDFDEGDTWRDGLDRLLDGLISEARLNDLGVEIAALDVVRPLKNRLQIVDWRKAHPEVASESIGRPIFIVGQPRTGTTILFDLLAQDPQLRPPLTWEVEAPCPVPRPETYDSDPRIAEAQASLDMTEQIIPGFLAFHPMGALVGQECVRITAGQFCSMIFSVQYRLPT
jgi:Sulfotransferase family